MVSWLKNRGIDTDKSIVGGRSDTPFRFWLKPGSDATLIFLTNGADFILSTEHNLKIDGKWGNVATCLQEIGKPCPLCKLAEKTGQGYAYKAWFFTVIDTSEYTDKQGKEHKNQTRLFVAKSKTRELLKRKYLKLYEQEKDFRFSIFEVYRSAADKSPAVGDEFEYKGHVDKKRVEQEDLNVEELNYEQILMPNPELVEQYAERLSGNSRSDSEKSEQVPF